MQVELARWGALDRGSAWAQFAAGAASASVVAAAAQLGADAVLGVDWTSFPAYQALANSLGSQQAPIPPFVFMNYRCHPGVSLSNCLYSCWYRAMLQHVHVACMQGVPQDCPAGGQGLLYANGARGGCGGAAHRHPLPQRRRVHAGACHACSVPCRGRQHSLCLGKHEWVPVCIFGQGS